MPVRISYIAMMVLVCALSCGSSAHPDATPSVSGTPIGPVPPPAGPVPAALVGTWHQVNTREKMKLGSEGYRFYFQPGLFASGQIAVTGSTISFSGNADCPGTGTYAWTLKSGTLHFEVLGVDPCPRSINLKGQDWVRVR